MYMQMGGWCLTTSGAKVPVYMVELLLQVVCGKGQQSRT